VHMAIFRHSRGIPPPSRARIPVEAIFLIALCILSSGFHAYLWRHTAEVNFKHRLQLKLQEVTGEGTPEEKLVVLLQKNVEQQEEIAAVRKELEDLRLKMDDKIRGKEKQIGRLQDAERFSRKQKARMEDKLGNLLIVSVRAQMALLNLTGGELEDVEELLQQQANADLTMKHHLMEEAFKNWPKRKKKKMKHLEEQVIEGQEGGYDDMDDSSKFAMRKLSEVVRELRGNGSHITLPAIRPVLGALLDDGEFEDFDSMLEAGQEDPETLDLREAQFVSRRDERRGSMWLNILRHFVDTWLHGTSPTIPQEVKLSLFRQMPGQHLSVARVAVMVNMLRGEAKLYDKCAVVGNSQRMLLTERGRDIDSNYAAVMRLNQAPTEGFETWVGGKTDFRMINNFWANTYTRKGEKKLASDETLKKKLALEPNVTLIVSRTDAFRYMKLVQLVERLRPDVGVVMLAREGVDVVGKYLRGLKLRIETTRGMEYAGKGSPSSGFVAIYLMMQVCKEVDVFGVGQLGETTSWHYWEERNFLSSREFGLEPHHSFDLERDVLQMLDEAGLIRLQGLSNSTEDKSYVELKEIVPGLLKEVRRVNAERVDRAIKAKEALEKYEREQEVSELGDLPDLGSQVAEEDSFADPSGRYQGDNDSPPIILSPIKLASNDPDFQKQYDLELKKLETMDYSDTSVVLDDK